MKVSRPGVDCRRLGGAHLRCVALESAVVGRVNRELHLFHNAPLHLSPPRNPFCAGCCSLTDHIAEGRKAECMDLGAHGSRG